MAAMPEAKARAPLPLSIAATLASRAARVGFCVRAYSYPLCTPSASWTYVDVWKIGVMIAPVEGSGDWPAWMQRVEKRARSVGVTVARLRYHQSFLPVTHATDHVPRGRR